MAGPGPGRALADQPESEYEFLFNGLDDRVDRGLERGRELDRLGIDRLDARPLDEDLEVGDTLTRQLGGRRLDELLEARRPRELARALAAGLVAPGLFVLGLLAWLLGAGSVGSLVTTVVGSGSIVAASVGSA